MSDPLVETCPACQSQVLLDPATVVDPTAWMDAWRRCHPCPPDLPPRA